MASDKKILPFNILDLPALTAITLTLLPQAAVLAQTQAKFNTTPLPHSSDFYRPNKDFSGGGASTTDREPLAPSRWAGRRPDYRDEEKRKKEEEAQNAIKAQQEQKRQIEAQKKAEQDKVNAGRQAQINAIEANNRAIALGKAKRWNEAISQHEQAVKLDPSNKQFRINLSAARCTYGIERMSQKDYQGAAHLFRKALTAIGDNALAAKNLSEAISKQGLDPTNADNRLGLGDQLAYSGDLEGAMIEYQQAMQLDPSARTYTKMGDMAMRYGQVQNAASWYRQALGKDQNFGPAHRQLGVIAMSQRDFTTAAASLRRAVVADNKDAVAGQALIDIWRKQVSQNPTLADNHLGLAGAMQLTGDYSGAESEYMQAKNLNPTDARIPRGLASLQAAIKHDAADRHKQAAETFLGQGLNREALAEAGQAIMMEPQNYEYQIFHGQCLEANGDYNGAMNAYRTAVQIKPNNTEAAQRMRELQERGSQPMQPAQQMPPQAARNTDQNKNLYEGIDQGLAQHQSQNAVTDRFNTHDDSALNQMALQSQNTVQPKTINHPQAVAPENSGTKKGTTNGAPPQDQATRQILMQAKQLEEKRDYQGAVDLLRQANLQSAEAHHRLALNLLNLGITVEAVSEFRIASALEPGNKIYSEDLARALNIHKSSLDKGDTP